MKSILFTSLAAVGLVFGSGWSRADDKLTAQEDRPLTTEEFIKVTCSAGLKEVKLAQLAESQAQSKEVKDFARQMIEDHTKANAELKDIASRTNIVLPTRMIDKHQEIVDKLTALTGDQFDQAYLRHMVESHKKAIKIFEHQAQEGQDPTVKAFASKTLPTLKKHLEEAERNVKK